jgi:hypothetical protein
MVCCHESKQFVLLRVYLDSCYARAWRTWWAGRSNQQAAKGSAAEKHAGRNLSLLAFHGCPLVVFAGFTNNEILDWFQMFNLRVSQEAL